ncbi:hypothetical protein A7U58_15225 [Burkholderia pseudomallei]|nr:hypothetical protein A7U58_15225 [Burkholderia pseudomallei]ANW57305.1 hypothetical protein A7U59_15200 [Burkholderia pseudomallei]
MVVIFTAENVTDNLYRCSYFVEWLQVQDLAALKRNTVIVGIFFKKCVKDHPCSLTIAGKRVAAPYACRSLFSSRERAVKREVADQIEDIVSFAVRGLLAQGVEGNSQLLYLV